MKCWMFEETGEFRKPLPGEWYLEVGGEPCLCYGDSIPAERILKLTEYPSNPLEPIREVWDKWEPEIKQIANWGEHTLKAEICQAIQKCMAIVGGNLDYYRENLNHGPREHDPFPEKEES